MSHTEYMRDYRARQKELGLCRDCQRKPIPRQTLCPIHAYKASLYNQKYYRDNVERFSQRNQEWRDRMEREGKCNRCGIPLIEGEGKRCINCIISSHGRGVRGVLNDTFRASAIT